MAIKTSSILPRDLIVLENENNPESSDIITIRPSTVLDQVFDDRSATNKTLRTILEELRADIATGGRGDIHFPVTSVNGKTGNIVLDKSDINLDKVTNTSDDEKPLSSPQRIAVNEILANYDFHIDLTRFEEHITNMENPHGVTLAQLDVHGEVTDTINGLIRVHNRATDSHADIRQSISTLNAKIDTTEESVERLIDHAMTELSNHNFDDHAHQVLFDSKESISNKAQDFDIQDHIKYPTTRAVVEFVANKLLEFKDELPDIKNWVADIDVVNTRANLPSPSPLTNRNVCFIRYGNGNHPEAAICRANPSGRTYDWEIFTLSTYSKFDDRYFTENTSGLSINITPIAEKVLEDDVIIESIRAQLERLMPSIMGNYYTKTEIDSFHFVKSIHMLPGTQDGTIRYYINDDPSTMSDDIHITGLQRLAFLEWVTEGELADQSVHSRHILDRAIEHRHMGNKAVSYKNMQASHMTMLGNLEDQTNNTVQEITIPELARTLNPYIEGGGAGDGRFVILTEEEVLDIIHKAHRKERGWIDPEIDVNVFLDKIGGLIVEYDHEDPIIQIDENGYFILDWNNTTTDNALLRFRFIIDDNGDLIVSYSEVDPNIPAEFIPLNEYMMLEYSEAYPAPIVSFNENGELILTSFDTATDIEIEKYRFIQTTDGDTIMFYDWPNWEDLPVRFDEEYGDLVLTYDDAYGQPEIWLDRTDGYLYLNSYDTEIDEELERYVFKINSEGELEATYLE